MSKQNTLITENLQLLDNALDSLIQSETLSLHIDDLRIKLIKETDKTLEINNPNNNTIEELFDDIYSHENQKTKNLIKINEVLLLLESEKLIKLIEENHIRITYEGIIQQSKGYLNTYKYEKSIQNRLDAFDKFQRSSAKRMNCLTFWIMIGTLVAAVYYTLQIFSLHICFCN